MSREKRLGQGKYRTTPVYARGEIDGVVVYLEQGGKPVLKLNNQEESDLFDFLLEHMTRLVQARKAD